MQKLTKFVRIVIVPATAAFATALSTASVAQTKGPIGRQEAIKDGTAIPDTANFASDREVVVAPAPMPDSMIENGTIGSTISRPTEIVPKNRGAPGIDGSGAAPVRR